MKSKTKDNVPNTIPDSLYEKLCERRELIDDYIPLGDVLLTIEQHLNKLKEHYAGDECLVRFEDNIEAIGVEVLDYFLSRKEQGLLY